MATTSKATQLRGMLQDRYSSPAAFLQHIGEKLHQYHRIPKDEYRRLDDRIAMLKELSELASKYLTTFKVDIGAAAARHEDNQKHSYLNRHMSGAPQEESVDRNVLSLARRSLRKAAYLKLLKRYYSKSGAGYQYRTAQALMDYIRNPQEKSAEFVGLSPGVRMEQLDFAHRGDFEVDDTVSCGAAFLQWTTDPHRGDTPFFLWLENHQVCLEDDKGKVETHGVAYVRADRRETADSRSRLKLLIVGSPIQSVDLTKMGGAVQIASTAGYQAERRKDPRGEASFGADVAAFVWTEATELFIANHSAQEFHHSSFVSGQRVRCAGMLVVENGKVTGLSNNSGHYKPRKEHVRNLVLFLQGSNALDSNAAIEVHLGNKNTWTGNPASFLSSYATM
jgi:hypothetical protein